MKIISPTGSWTLRNDEAGQGFFGAPRGKRSHNGVDLECVPGQVVLSPISGKIVREAYPYAGDLKWTGCLIVAKGIEIKMFYMRLYHHIRKELKSGSVRCVERLPIGVCQDITNKYPDQGMTPHLHLEAKIMQRVNPMDLV
jgi:hypothetical protein